MEITGTIKQVNNIDGTVAATRQTIGSTNYSPIRWVDGEEVAPLIEPVVREVIEEVGIDSTAVRNQSTVSGTTVTDALNTLKNSTPDNLLTDDILNSSDVDGETATYALNQLNTDISTLSSTVGEHTTEIAGLDGDLQDLTGVVNGNTASINQLNQSLVDFRALVDVSQNDAIITVANNHRIVIRATNYNQNRVECYDEGWNLLWSMDSNNKVNGNGTINFVGYNNVEFNRIQKITPYGNYLYFMDDQGGVYRVAGEQSNWPR